MKRRGRESGGREEAGRAKRNTAIRQTCDGASSAQRDGKGDPCVTVLPHRAENASQAQGKGGRTRRGGKKRAR